MPGINKEKTKEGIVKGLEMATEEELKEIAKILGAGVYYSRNNYNQVVCSTRPYFGPDQVRFPDELVPGYTYEYVHHQSSEPYLKFFKVLEKPYLVECSPHINDWRIKVQWMHSYREERISLQDASIYPYANGRWNAWNYIAFTDASRDLQNLTCRYHCSDCHSRDNRHCC